MTPRANNRDVSAGEEVAVAQAGPRQADLEKRPKANPGGILEDGPLLIIGRQVPTDLGKSIDLLGVDREATWSWST